MNALVFDSEQGRVRGAPVALREVQIVVVGLTPVASGERFALQAKDRK